MPEKEIRGLCEGAISERKVVLALSVVALPLSVVRKEVVQKEVWARGKAASKQAELVSFKSVFHHTWIDE